MKSGGDDDNTSLLGLLKGSFSPQPNASEQARVPTIPRVLRKQLVTGGSGMRPRLAWCSLRRLFLWILILSLIAWLWWFNNADRLSPDKWQINHRLQKVLIPPQPQCSLNLSSANGRHFEGTLSKHGSRHPGRVLIIPKTSYSKTFKAVTALLVANKIKYKSTVSGKNLPDLIKISKGVPRYGAIFFEDYRSYLQMDAWNRDILDKYCRMFKIGIIALVPRDDSVSIATLKDKHLRAENVDIVNLDESSSYDMTVNAKSSLLRITKGGIVEPNVIDSGVNWVSFRTNHDTFDSSAWALDKFGNHHTVILQDRGHVDQIPKVLFGGDIRNWINILLLLDSLNYVSRSKISIPLTRFILIDIDDVFVGKKRFHADDVDALIKSQQRLSQLIPGFRYNLGFSGGYFLSGDEEQNLGDKAILENKNSFWWFPHMWKHQQPHLFDNVKDMITDMEKNKEFSISKEIPLENRYSVAPHHSGVYPVHEQLYEAWRTVWDIKVTSTEEYPHLRPARLRRGFQHEGIKVLPRQTCGLFTKNLYYSEYPGGPEILERSINGGELFQTVLFNPVSIFMTHMPNYCYDRLAPYTFESVVTKLKCWTNLELLSAKPERLADIYFTMHPEELGPIWGNPCDDQRHMDIWSKSKTCKMLPDILVIGPQKTGTTALYTFLKLHPAIRSNEQSPVSFEELQFFSGESYELGIDWYMSFFPLATSTNANHSTIEHPYLFEKSATYFDHDLAPIRAHRLLPRAQLIVILISPVDRAYSWYHHKRAHNDPVALQYSFFEVISAGASSERPLRQLQARCLEPGHYHAHLERWLNFYKAKQLHIIDGEELKSDPVTVMNNLQHFLNIHPFYDYSKRLVFDQKKGFFCEVTDNGQHKCLGRGKGRNYPPMDLKSKKYLRDYYRLRNEALLKQLKRLGYAIPNWLEEDLKDSSDQDVKNVR